MSQANAAANAAPAGPPLLLPPLRWQFNMSRWLGGFFMVAAVLLVIGPIEMVLVVRMMDICIVVIYLIVSKI